MFLIYYVGDHGQISSCKISNMPYGSNGKPLITVLHQVKLTLDEFKMRLKELENLYPYTTTPVKE